MKPDTDNYDDFDFFDECTDRNSELNNSEIVDDFFGVINIDEKQEQFERSNYLDDVHDSREPTTNSPSGQKPENSWWHSLSDSERAEFRQQEEDAINDSCGCTAIRNGKPTLTYRLKSILYCDQIMELEVIMDELWKDGWNYGKAGEKVVLMLLAKSPLFTGSKKSGFECQSSHRRWISQNHWSGGR